MGTVEKVIGVMLGLIALYLVLANSGAFNTIMQGLGTFNLATIGALQGRMVNVKGYGVNLGGNSIGGAGGPTKFGAGPIGFGL